MQVTDEEANEVEAEVNRVIIANLAEWAITISVPCVERKSSSDRCKLGDLE